MPRGAGEGATGRSCRARFSPTSTSPGGRDFTFAGPPWEGGPTYDRASPLEDIGGASVPTLVQHVEDDPSVPMAGGRRFYRALLEQLWRLPPKP